MAVLKFEIAFTGSISKANFKFCYYTDGMARVYKDGVLLWDNNWASDWAHMHFLCNSSEDGMLLFSYKPGVACVDKITPKGSTELQRMDWAKDWQSFAVLYNYEGHNVVLESRKRVGDKTITAYDEVFADGSMKEFKRVQK